MMFVKNIGPELPLELKTRSSENDDTEQAETQDDDESTRQLIGPALPPHLLSRVSDRKQTKTSPSKSKNSAAIGPALPPHLQHLADRADEAEIGASSSVSDSSDDGDAQIGPSIHLQGGEYDVSKEFAEREQRAKTSNVEVLQRDSWMTELPSDRTGVKIGLGARIFTKRDGEDVVLDDSWTATPGQEKQATKNGDKQTQNSQLQLIQRKRDAEIDEQLAEFNAAKRSRPLIDMVKDGKLKKNERREKKQKKKDKKHKKDKKSKKKAKKKKNDKSDDEKPAERKAFNWDEEMKVSMVDTSRAKSMLDKTLLQSRFASSKSQKYL